MRLVVWAFHPENFQGWAKYLSRFICWCTESDWCHIGLTLGDNYFEADLFQGVVELPCNPYNGKIIYTCRIPKEASWWLKSQLGKKYDFFGALGFIFKRRETREELKSSWFCSELASAMLQKFSDFPKELPPYKISPGKLVEMLNSE